MTKWLVGFFTTDYGLRITDYGQNQRLFMNRWAVTDPYVFFGIAGAVVSYLLYMMIRRRKGDLSGMADREPDL